MTDSAKNTSKWLARCGWLVALVYVVAAISQKRGYGLTVAGDLMQLLISSLVATAFAMNLRAAKGRIRFFWGLMALGSGLWVGSQAAWAYWEVVARVPVPDLTPTDIVLFLHLVPMMAALSTLPHEPRRMPPTIPLSLAMITAWWVYLYSFAVIPWQYVIPDFSRYGPAFNVLYSTEDMAFIVALGILAWRSSGGWRTFYRRMLWGSLGYTVSAHQINVAIDKKLYYTGSLYDIPLVFSLACMCWAASTVHCSLTPADKEGDQYEVTYSGWTTKLAIVALLSVPLLAAWSLDNAATPIMVRHFRVIVSLVAMVTLTLLLFALQHVLSRKLRTSLIAVKESLGELAQVRETLEYQATHDAMTGVMNRATIVNSLDRELARAARTGTRLAAMLIDLDYFKEINDRYGHHAGDVAIIACSARMQDCLRPHDYVGRYGGEEFLIIIADCDDESALQIADRIRERISGSAIGFNTNSISVTASIGIAICTDAEGSESLLRRADMALYSCKKSGRDKVAIADLGSNALNPVKSSPQPAYPNLHVS